jgi:hypothetical protein
VRLFFFHIEATTVHFRLQPKHVGKTSRDLEEGDSCRRLSLWLNRKLGEEKERTCLFSAFVACLLSMIINTLINRYCHRKKHLQGVHHPLPFSCGACDAEDDKDRQLSPSLNSLDVLPVRPKRHKAAVLLLCGKRTVGNACKCFVLSIHNMDNKQACLM